MVMALGARAWSVSSVDFPVLRTGVHLLVGPDALVVVTGNTIIGPDERDPDRDGPYGNQVFRGMTGTITGNEVAHHGNPDSEYMTRGIVSHAAGLRCPRRRQPIPRPW